MDKILLMATAFSITVWEGQTKCVCPILTASAKHTVCNINTAVHYDSKSD